MNKFSYYIHILLLYFIRAISFLIPKNRNLILFSSWFGEKYADSSKYMYEYLLEHSQYSIKWYSSDKGIYEDLKKKGLPVVYGKTIVGVWYQMRAKMLVSSIQLFDYNQFFIHRCIFFDLDHGFALKQVGFAIPEYNVYMHKYLMAIRRGIDYWMSAPTNWSMDKVRICYEINSDHIVRCNKPRTDVLFDDSLKKGVNEIVDKIKGGRKAVVWMPTHRGCGETKMSVDNLFDLNGIQKLCEERNFVFIIKKHYYHKHEKEELDQYENIFDLTGEDLDSQVILSQADVLVSDYSSSYIEYLVLDRPIVLYAYDKDLFVESERDLYIKLEDNTAGEIVTSKTDFLKSLSRISQDWYDLSFADGRKKARELYFDNSIPVGQYRYHVSTVIEKMLQGKYCPDWNN